MDRFFQSLRPFIRGVVRRAVWVLLAALALSAVSLYFAQSLRIDTDFAKLLPADYNSVQALEQLRETVGGESDVQVLVQSPSFEANRRFIEDLIPRALALTTEDAEGGGAQPYFTRAEFRRDADFLRDNALYFASSEELDQLETYLDDQIEQAKLEANPFYVDLGEDDAEPDTAAQNLQQVYEDLTVDEYSLSPDSTAMSVSFYPSGSKTDVGFVEDLDADLQALIAEMDPASYHPQMQTSVAGRTIRQMIELKTITNDVLGSFGVGVAAVLLFVVGYFFYKGVQARSGGRLSRRVLLAELARTPVMALLIGLPLLMSLAWTGGVAYLAFETLNLMTSTLGLVLFGLGIDFGIHFFARYAEERGDGRSVAEAAEQTFTSTGQAIAVGALTTAAGLYVLTAADFKGFSEFGFIAGTGILFALVAMTVVMPALLALAERTGLLNLQGASAAAGTPAVTSRRRFPAARGIVVASLVAVVAGAALLPLVNFQYDFGALEPDYEAWDARTRIGQAIEEDGGGGRNPAYIVTDDPSEVPAVVAAVREAAAQDTLSPTIDHVESLQDRFPLSDEGQQAKLQRIAEIRELLGGRYLRADSSEDLQNLRRAAETRQPIPLAEVPGYLKDRFISKGGAVGGIVMIYPSVGLSDGRQSIAFAHDVGEIEAAGQTYYASSTSLVAADMLELMLDEAPWMVLATFLIVALLMGLNFRSLRWAALALVPLVVGVLWMLLLMEVFGLALNFYNIIVLPAVLGIGNDAGVHLVHRYREEGRGSIRAVLRSTGEHVAMGSLTTMIGFGGLLLSFHPGLHSIGTLAVAGIGATLLAALLFLPAMLQWLEDRRATPADPAEASATNGQSGEAAQPTAGEAAARRA